MIEMHFRRWLAASLLLCSSCAGSDSRTAAPLSTPQRSIGEEIAKEEPLRFSMTSGIIGNHFYREGPVAAHCVTKSGTSPRFVVAFPAGNAAVGVWFSTQEKPIEFQFVPDTRLEPVIHEGGMRGVSARLRANVGRFRLDRALLTNVRIVRDFTVGEEAAAIPPALLDTLAHETVRGQPLVLRRKTLDGRHIELHLSPDNGTVLTFEEDDPVFISESGVVEFHATALTDYEPLTPLPTARVLRPGVGGSERLRNVLTFLSYEEKLLAGSWRFLTYFGRDTLISVLLLLPVLEPPAIEAGLGSVLERLAPDGNVAHEEDLGEFAAIKHLREGPPMPADLSQPIFDYKMIDDDLLLAPVAAAYLLDTPEGRARAEAFLSKTTSSGWTYRHALRQNLAFVVARATPYALKPVPEHLLSIWAHTTMGQWRDSLLGLDGARVPFDVNTALVPAALDAASRVFSSDLMGPDPAAAKATDALVPPWLTPERHFRMTVPEDIAKERIRAYAMSERLDPAPALASIDGPVRYHALALYAPGAPLPVMHSDTSFSLLYAHPSPEVLELAAQSMIRPFPAGLLTNVGLVIANPALAGDPSISAAFTRFDYHGTVVWSFQQAMLAAGLSRQLARSDLPARTRALLEQADRAVWQAIRKTEAHQEWELWTWEPRDGQAEFLLLGQKKGHEAESNAAQLWSTLFLAISSASRSNDMR